MDFEADTQEITLPAVSEAQMVWRLKGREAGRPFVAIFVPNGMWQDRVEVFGEVR